MPAVIGIHTKIEFVGLIVEEEAVVHIHIGLVGIVVQRCNILTDACRSVDLVETTPIAHTVHLSVIIDSNGIHKGMKVIIALGRFGLVCESEFTYFGDDTGLKVDLREARAGL